MFRPCSAVFGVQWERKKGVWKTYPPRGQIVAMAQRELPQIYPQPGWVEHDPLVIWQTQMEDTAREVLLKAGLQASDIRALGITSQRETTVVWNRSTGLPIRHAIV